MIVGIGSRFTGEGGKLMEIVGIHPEEGPTVGFWLSEVGGDGKRSLCPLWMATFYPWEENPALAEKPGGELVATGEGR